MRVSILSTNRVSQKRSRRFEAARVPPLAWECLGGVILFCTVIPYLLNSWALARTHAGNPPKS